METNVNCIPCFYRQAIEAARMAGADDALIKRIVDKIGFNFRKFNLTESPPAIARKIHKIIRSETGVEDPYKKLKTKSNFWALGLLPQLEERVAKFQDKLLSATHIAIAGNIIDYGANTELNLQENMEAILGIEEVQPNSESPYFSYSAFHDAVEHATKILYLGDNAGEAVFDRILLQQIKALDPDKKIYFSVRSAPILNDALEEDARECGIDTYAEIVSTGCSAPGIIFELCSEEFLEHYHTADLVISKGQGNYESLLAPDRQIFYLFIAKCPVVARSLDCEVGQAILSSKQPEGLPGA